MSHDRLAQYWVALGHVSFYQRVDIGALMQDDGRGQGHYPAKPIGLVPDAQAGDPR